MCAESAGEPQPDGIKLDADDVAVVNRLADLSAGAEEAHEGEMQKLLEQLKGLSHGVFHKLVETLLGAYMEKWYEDIPCCGDELENARMTIQMSFDHNQHWSREYFTIKWSGEYSHRPLLDTSCPVPHKD